MKLEILFILFVASLALCVALQALRLVDRVIPSSRRRK